MLRGNIVFIESPEAHLHPSAQVKIAEFLVTMAKSGRIIIAETHSDLIVKCILRNILSEEISQGDSAIYFSSISGSGRDSGSNVSQIQVNQSGRISNWPIGFMDELSKENARLLDIVYGE
jgi:predicted ATPase